MALAILSEPQHSRSRVAPRELDVLTLWSGQGTYGAARQTSALSFFAGSYEPQEQPASTISPVCHIVRGAHEGGYLIIPKHTAEASGTCFEWRRPEQKRWGPVSGTHFETGLQSARAGSVWEDELREWFWFEFLRLSAACNEPCRDLITRIEALSALPADWNGYGAIPIDPGIIATATQFVRSYGDLITSPVQAVPMTRGRLQLEWHQGKRALEIEFDNTKEIHYFRCDPASGTEAEDIVSIHDHETIRSILKWFTSEKPDGERTGTGTPG